MVKTMSFRVVTQQELAAVAYIKNAKLVDESTWCQTLEFASEEAALGMYNALNDNGYNMIAVHLEGNRLAFGGSHHKVHRSTSFNPSIIEVEWYVDAYHHIQVEEGISGFIKRPRSFRKKD